MANRYWVGGTGIWGDTNTANWSTSSGGAGGASVPTAFDDVYIDANSGTGTITVDPGGNNSFCKNLDFTGYTGTFLINSGRVLKTYGDVTLSPSMTYGVGTGTLTLYTPSGTTSSSYINTNGVTINSNVSIGNNTSSTYPIVLLSDLRTSKFFTVNDSEYISGPSYSLIVEGGINTGNSGDLYINNISSLTVAGSGTSTLGGLTNVRIHGGKFIINSSGTVNLDGFKFNGGLFKYVSGNVVTNSSSQIWFNNDPSVATYIETENSLGQYINFQGTVNIATGSPGTEYFYFNKDLIISGNLSVGPTGSKVITLYSVGSPKMIKLKTGSTLSTPTGGSSYLTYLSSGGVTISIEGTCTWTSNNVSNDIFQSFGWNIDIVFNSGTETITLGTDISYRGTLTYTSGIINIGTKRFLINYDNNVLNVNSNCAFYDFMINPGYQAASSTVTINGLLYINNRLSFEKYNYNSPTYTTFIGTGGFSTSKIYCNLPRTVIFNSGITYTVRDEMINIGSSNGLITYKSYSPTIQSTFVLNYGATQSNLYTNGTLMNSQPAQTVWVVNGALSGTTNWGVVPVPTTLVDIFY